MAQLISVKLSRFDGSPWGFRLQGGKDFGTPLIVQKVNGGSPAEAAGLRAGDAVIKVNNIDTFNLRHKDAQDVIVRAGNSFEVTVQRGGSTWRPSVSPVTPTIPTPQPTLPVSNVAPVTKTSLAAKKSDGPLIGSGHNLNPKPFSNGSDTAPIKSIVNKQYNSPVGIYSEQTIAETLSAQAEVLAGGVLGVNFKKNEKNYNAGNSEVFKMVQEADKEPRTPEPAEPAVHSGVVTPSSPALAGLRSVTAPETKPQPSPTTPHTSLPPGQNICADCERLIVGVFVRIKEKNLHVECFKCSTCGTSLKNVGYYNINNKLYCDIHAKLVARQQAPSGYVPITVSPTPKAPAGTISAALGNIPNYSSLSSPLNGTSLNSAPTQMKNYHTDSMYQREYNDVKQQQYSSSLTNGEQTHDSYDGAWNGNEKTFRSTIIIRTGSETHPAVNISGPKPFGGFNSDPASKFSPLSPITNPVNNYSQPQSQTITESYHSECNYYEEEVIEEPPQSSIDENSRPPSSVKVKSLQWPPVKSLQDVTYPTASPIWIDPNPVLHRRPQQNVHEKRTEIEDFSRQRASYCRERYQPESTPCCRGEDTMDPPSSNCNTPFYRKTECTELRRQSRASSLSRPGSAEGTRRSLTPTRINQPTPRPWTATVSCDGYGHVEAPKPPEPPICRKVCTCRIVCERTSGPAGPEHEQEHTYHEVRCELCNPPPPVCDYEQTETQEMQEIVCEEEDNEVIDLSKIVPSDIAVCPKGVENQHNLYTETMEKDEGNIHIKKTTIYEKTVEVVSPEPPQGSTLDREVESFSDRKSCVESAEVVSSAIETNRMMEEARKEEEERRRAYEEDCRREQERIRREEEEEKRREENRLRIIQAEKEEKERRMKEQKRQTELRCRQEEEERSGRHVSFSGNQNASCVYHNQQQYYDEKINHEGRSEERKCYREVKNERQVQGSEQFEEDRHQSLREQVEVHKSLREQQSSNEKRATLQERRIANRFRPSSPPPTESQRKHVQFITENEGGVCPLSSAPVQNSTPKEWKSEMVKALTTAPDTSSYSNAANTKTMYSSQVRYEETCRPCPAPKPAPFPGYNAERPVSPFTEALTTAPERSYMSLNESKQYENVICVDRSETPTNQMTNEGYCHPAEILYTDASERQSRSREQTLKKVRGPCPLPTPPPDYKFRDCTPSPARTCSRSETPASLAVGLKKPNTIPSYQKHLVALEQDPVEERPYVPSRSPTPSRSKSPAPGPPRKPAAYVARLDASSEAAAVPRPNYPEYNEYRNSCNSSTDIEETNRSYSDCYTQRYQAQCTRVERESCPQATDESSCGISKVSSVQPSLPCPIAASAAISERIQRTGVRVLPTPPKPPLCTQTYESRQVCERTTIEESSNCPNTGVKILPCRAISDSGSRAGIVIVPCDDVTDNQCSRAGIRITPTPDRGLCVSPAAHNRSSSNCAGGGPRSGGCEIDIGNCPAAGVRVGTCTDGSVCVAPCKLPTGVTSVQCPKPILKPQCPAAKPIPFPHIPLPDEPEPSRCDSCPLKQPQHAPPPSTQDNCSFQPINGQPRTNLSNQLTRLTIKRDKQQVVQLFKPQAQSCTDGIHCEPSPAPVPSNQCRVSNRIPEPISKTQNSVDPPNFSHPDLGSGVGGNGSGGGKSGKFAGSYAPKRGRGILNQAGAGGRQPLCGSCNSNVRGPFITALGQIWCPEHFVCVNSQCRRPLQDIGFVEEKGQLYCEYCFERFIAPACIKCNGKIKGDCLNAIGKHYHPECFNCAYCGKLFGNRPFFLEEGLPYCEADWNELFTTKCFACGFPVEAGDRWVEALNNNYHSQCFNCTMCKKNLQGQSFYAKGGRPFCKNHAR